MEHALLGSTGLAVSRLGFGAMTFGRGTLVPGVDTDIGQNVANDMVAICLEYGVNLFDTADMYTSGEAEEILGQALDQRRSEVLLSTRCGLRSGEAVNARGGSYRYVLSAIEASLKRLGTDWIDLFFLHLPDPWTPEEQTLRALEDATRKGMIRYAGLSNFPAWKAAKMLGIQQQHGWSPLQAVQLYYSLLGRDLEDGYADFVQDAGLGLLTWSPLASGYLTGKYTDTRDPHGRRIHFDFPPIDTEVGDRVVGVLRELAEAHNARPAQVALAWQLSRPWITSVLVGASTMRQLDGNLQTVEIRLSSEDIARLDEVSAYAPRYPQWMQPMARDEVMAKRIAPKGSLQ